MALTTYEPSARIIRCVDVLLTPPSPDQEEAAAEAANAGTGATETVTVLVVEDDLTLQSVLAYNLRREGFRVLTAANGERALTIADREAYRLDLVVLDLMLPGIDGFQVLRVLRSHSDVPILVLTARGAEQDKVDGLEFGADDYVVKPFALRELLARVRALIRRRVAPAMQPTPVLFRGPLRIELDRRRVFIDAREVELRPKEYGLLVTLALAPGRVFGRQELLDTIWGEDIIVDDRTIDVHISWLRSKLTQAGLGHAVIRTVHGAGYRFVTPTEPAMPGGSEEPQPLVP